MSSPGSVSDPLPLISDSAAVMAKQRNASGCVGLCWEWSCGCCRAVPGTVRSWENWVHQRARRPVWEPARRGFTIWWAAPRTEPWSTSLGWRNKVFTIVNFKTYRDMWQSFLGGWSLSFRYSDCLKNLKTKCYIIFDVIIPVLNFQFLSNLIVHNCYKPDIWLCFCCCSSTGSWSNVEQSVQKVTDGLGCVPNPTLRTKLEESLSLVKGWTFPPYS